jgi:DNA-directed RNA polymerase subunit H (RpoH/RPB5)
MSNSYSPLISKIYKSRSIILDIMKKRGYNVEDYEGFSVSEVHSMNDNGQLDMFLESDTSSKKIYIKYHLETRLSDKHVYEYLEDLFGEDDDDDEDKTLKNRDEFIIVSKDKINASTQNLVDKIFKTDDKYINVYNVHDYLFNILDHEMVPNHRILNSEEKKEIINRYNVTKDSEFPEISRFDPVAKVIGIRPGELCEITRSSPMAVKTLYYRLCY